MEKAGEILKKILDKDSAAKAKYYNGLFSSWSEIVLEPLAAHSRVVDIELNQLLIAVDHPGWMQLFHFNEQKILKKIQEKYPELAIKAIKIRVESNPTYTHTPNETKAIQPMDDFNFPRSSNLEPGFENIKDGELRNIFINLYKTVVDKKEKEDS